MSGIPERIQKLKQERNAVILAHTYQPGEIQDIADFVGDSYGLSVEASSTSADIIIFCGVMFMAETAAILNPGKKVIVPDSSAGCPMADMITAKDLSKLKLEYPSHMVICYVNSTAEVKALSDICCTSSNAEKIVRQIPEGTGIIFVPDKHLGSWVIEKTGHDMVLWNGFCPTHARITPEMMLRARREHPQAVLFIHPEAPKECRALADEVLSTGGMCTRAQKRTENEFVIATETGLLHTLRRDNPSKIFYPVDNSITCPNMRKGSMDKLLSALDGTGGKEISVPDKIAEKARRSLQKMLVMSR